MTTGQLSEAEKIFIIHGVADDFRIDGRTRKDYRPIEIEAGIVSHAFGSSRLRLANTDILVTVKLEIDTPAHGHPKEGKIEFFVDCSANATPNFEGRGGESLAIEISNSLATAFANKAFDLTKLCIMEGRKCWKIYVDILLLEVGGNLYDAVSLAVKAALFNTKIPKLKSVCMDGNNVDIEVSEEIDDCQRLDVKDVPLMVTLCKIGDHCVVDPSTIEEQCSSGAIVVCISQGQFTGLLKTGAGSFQVSTLTENLLLSTSLAKQLDEVLMNVLAKDEQRQNTENVGFLR